ncbi:ABC transporter ATP-binding protein [bacterium]|nr:MAG: ABC transporter ATP-binding protein [bacterium]
MNDIIIETQGLTRFYGEKKVVDSLDLSIARGTVTGFLGRNGAGKTTTIRMLLGLVEPTRGTSTVFGEPSLELSPETKGRIGYLAEGHHVYEWMTVKESGRFQKSFYPRWNQDVFDGIIGHFDLDPKKLGKHLSRGQRAGLCLALTLAPEPELLVLDDPGLGLDTVMRRTLLEALIYVTRQDNCTILFSSHIMSDIERVADHLCVIDHGTVRANCSVDTFRESIVKMVLRFDGEAPAAPQLPNLLQSTRNQSDLSVVVANYDEAAAAALQKLGARDMVQVPMTLEEASVAYLDESGEKNFFLSRTRSKGGTQ